MLARFFIRVFTASETGRPAPLGVTFDEAAAALARLPKMFVEPDGSFVWRSLPGETLPWQVEGNLVDGGSTLYYVELQGTCPDQSFNALLACFTPSRIDAAVDDGEQRQWLFESVEQGEWLNEQSFLARATLQ